MVLTVKLTTTKLHTNTKLTLTHTAIDVVCLWSGLSSYVTYSRIIPSDARSGHRSISSMVLSTDCGIVMPYLASHLSRLDMSDWSTLSASRSTLDRGRSNAADDDGHSLVNGREGRSWVRPRRKLWATGSRCEGSWRWLETFTCSAGEVGSVVNDVVVCSPRDKSNNNTNSTVCSIVVWVATPGEHVWLVDCHVDCLLLRRQVCHCSSAFAVLWLLRCVHTGCVACIALRLLQSCVRTAHARVFRYQRRVTLPL